MNIDIAASLNQRQRDALLSYYLGQYVPASSNPDLVSLVQTPEDVYEYLLIDPLVSNAVPTSRVAQAMSSIQQYINGISMNMEPGYTTQSLDQENISNWKGGLSQYDIWAGEVELDTYPENYIDPTLRQSQTTYFKELITDLNQNTINDDTAHHAVMNYLNKFEQVANLNIVSGYLGGTDQTKDMYYFLGKSTSSPIKYYWRSFDMSQNVDNNVATGAWSEWFPMNTTINEDALQGIPRMAYFNNRLYLFWFERKKGGNVEGTTEGETYDTITAYSSYNDFSNNWSAPYSLWSVNSNDNYAYCSLLFSATYLNTICMYDKLSNCMTVSLYSGDNVTATSGSFSDFSLKIDYWFNIAKAEAGDTSTKSALSQYLYNYLSNPEDDKEGQDKIQTNCELGSLIISSVVPTSQKEDDFAGKLKLPVLNSDSFRIDVPNSTVWSLTGTIPFSDTWYKGIFKISGPLRNDFEDEIGRLDTDLDIDNNVVSDIVLSQDAGFPSLTIDNVSISFDNPPTGASFEITAVTLNSPGTVTVPTTNLSLTGIDLSNSTYTYFYFFEGKFPAETEMCRTYPIFFSDCDTDTLWTYQIKESVSSGAWANGTSLHTDTQKKFSATAAPQVITLTDFTTTEIKAGSATRYIAFGYTADGNTCYQEYQVSVSQHLTISESPVIVRNSSDNAGYGYAVYLEFDDSSISDIRLNTLFAKELINKASVSMQALLNWDTQLTQEPPMTADGSGATTSMDFSGANGLYFWELFFYMPYLVAWRLAQEQQYSDALDWYHYIFDPAARDRDNSSDIRKQYPEPDYWSVRPLVETPSSGAQASAVWLTTDPDALASASPVHYQKAVFMAYVSTLMAAADASYRLLTNDGLSLARLQYGQVRDLLGPRPDGVIINHWVPESLEALAADTGNSAALTDFEQQAPALPAFPGQASAADEATTSDVFMAPVNTQLLGYWNTLDSRLYNLRHWLNLDGQPLNIPLYAPPVNPTQLMEQSVQGGSLISTAAGVVVTVPPYRFAVMLQSARTAASILSQFGQTLLSYGERQDATSLQELDAQQLFNLSSYTLQLQQNAIDALDKDQAVLEKSRDMAQQRRDHYQALYNQNMSGGEVAAMALQDASSAAITAASPFITAGMAMRTIPNIFGLADGGEDIGAPTIAAGMVMQLTGEIQGIAARQTETSEGYKRRREEWDILRQQAQSEMDVINAQLDALTVRQTGASTALELATQQQTYLKTTLNFLTTRFTQSALYNWLTGQLSALYYQAYDATLSLCLSAEACWQYEMGDITTRFIQTGTWNDNYRGLLVGETLQLNLQQMESAWLNRYTRRLEITKTISLKNLPDFDLNGLKDNGKASFSLTESLFDDDYPGHYLRQIKSVTVSLPALVGPYQDVRMTLTQSGSRVLLKPDINGVNYLNDPTKGSATSILTNPRASQQVAVSSGLNDAGLFVLNFGDERYLPFEGTGAVSDWLIAFPNPTSAEQKALLASLNDVIVQVHYTAIYGGSSFEQAVTAL